MEKNLHLDRRNFIKLLLGALIVSKEIFANVVSILPKTHLEKLNKSRRIVAYFDINAKQLFQGVNMIYVRSKVSVIIEKIELHVKYNN